ncbi:MAG TPA: hypothetical protein VIH57_24035 [Bacteroidales bacterium]
MSIDFKKLAEIIVNKTGDFENNIIKFKVFYKRYLIKVEKKQEIQRQLYSLLEEIQIQIQNGVYPTRESLSLDKSIETFFKEKFHPDLVHLYNTEVPFKSQKNKKLLLPEDNVVASIFLGLAQSLAIGFSEALEKQKAEWNYKLEFIKFLYQSIYYSGLHPDIEKRRNIDSAFRYNVILVHSYKLKNKKTELKILLPFEKLKSDFLAPYEQKLPIKINGRLIPFDDIYSLNISSTILKDDEIELWAAKNGFHWNSNKKNEKALSLSCEDVTDNLLSNPYLIQSIQGLIYIEKSRIDELKAIINDDFDLTKLISFCEELNSVASNSNYASCAFLVRAIIDHVPPIFGAKSFTEFANSSNQSIKKSMLKLQESARNIADGLIHLQIRKKEALSTFTQVDFRQEMDLLLGEVYRILK